MAAEVGPRVWPFPEALPRVGPWTLRRSGLPRVDIGARRMWVPVGASPVDMCRRLHEMAHARWSWTRPPRATRRGGPRLDTFMAVEDARMHLRLGACGLDLSAGMLDPGDTRWFTGMLAASPFPLRVVILALVAVYGTGSRPVLEACARHAARRATERGDGLRRAAIEQALDLAAAAAQRIDVPRPLTRDTLRAARWLDEALGDGGEPVPAGIVCLVHGADGPVPPGEPAPWGALTIESPPRPVRMAGLVSPSRWRAADHGVVPRAWHRWALDAAVFAERTRGGAGTVLVDVSGSMRLEAGDVRAAMVQLPALTLATYSGSGDRGVVRIVARGGWRVTDALLAPPAGPGNVVDGPALEWLAREPGPRLWVSDGGATGVGDHGTTGNADICSRTCRRADIRRVRTLAAAVAALR